MVSRVKPECHWHGVRGPESESDPDGRMERCRAGQGSGPGRREEAPDSDIMITASGRPRQEQAEGHGPRGHGPPTKAPGRRASSSKGSTPQGGQPECAKDSTRSCKTRSCKSSCRRGALPVSGPGVRRLRALRGATPRRAHGRRHGSLDPAWQPSATGTLRRLRSSARRARAVLAQT